jgi:hypothetical protein
LHDIQAQKRRSSGELFLFRFLVPKPTVYAAKETQMIRKASIESKAGRFVTFRAEAQGPDGEGQFPKREPSSV